MTASTSLRVRAVRGRVVDPYRGTPDEATLAEQLAQRKAEPVAFAEIVEILKGLGVEVKGQGRRFKLKRTDETLLIAIASAAPRVSLEDVSFEGDPLLAIDLLHALVPLFGAVELRVGDHRELIDGHEAAHLISARYRAYWIAESLERAKQIPNPVQPASRPPTANASAPGVQPTPIHAERPRAAHLRGDKRMLIILAALILAAIVSVTLYESHFSKAKLGEFCTRNDSCRSDECLPSAPIKRTVLQGVDLTSLTAHPGPGGAGVCTEECTDDASCPMTMSCGEVMQFSSGQFSTGFGSKVRRCIPRAWDLAPRD